MALVTIRRSTEWLNSFRNLHIYIDGRELATLRSKEQKIIHMPEGEHEVEARFNWLGSKKKQIVIADGEYSILEVKTRKLTTITNATAISVLPVYIFYVLPFTGLFMTLSTAILLYLFYILMYGNRYLEVDKVQG